MRISDRKILIIGLILSILFIPINGLPHASSSVGPLNGSVQEASSEHPKLAEIIPLSIELTDRLADHKKKIINGLDIAAVETQYSAIETRLKAVGKQLERLKELGVLKKYKLLDIKRGLKQDKELYTTISMPITQTVRQLESWREAWLTEQKRWQAWRTILNNETDLKQLETTFEKADATIETAIEMVLSRLQRVLALQNRTGKIKDEINALEFELNTLVENERRIIQIEESYPIFSEQYLALIKNSDIWSTAIQLIGTITLLDNRFFAQYGWVLFYQAAVSLLVVISIYRNRRLLNESVRWRFFAARPLSVGLSVGYVATVLISDYAGGIPNTWYLSIMIVAGISFARLIAALTDTSWKKRFIYGLAVVSIVTRVLEVLGFPTPLFRLYTVLTASIGLLFCLRWAKESTHLEESRLYTWSLRVAALFFSFIILAECGGQGALASHLFIFFIRLVGSILASIMFMYMIRGVLEWLFQKSLLKRTSMFSIDDNEPIINRLARFIDVAFVGLVLMPATLMFWGVYDSLGDATKALLSMGFTLGTLRIDVGLLLVATGILYLTTIASWIIQKLLLDDLIFKGRFDKGVSFSIGRLVHYALILFGFMFALSALGFELSKITIMLSALGVGIGFGLQGIANNFFSGLILLFERPVRVGDVIQVAGERAEIKKIGIRATTVETFDRADRIIPNTMLVSDEVINWTLTNRQVRLIIPVGVAYGSDIDQVTDTLLACARTNPKVVRRPEPRVRFLNFGESSLDFELRVYVADFDQRIEVKSDLHYQIVRSFRAANIEIPFPQRDLHFRNGSVSDVSQPSDADG